MGTIDIDDPDDDSDEATQERQANATPAGWILPDGLGRLPDRLSGPWVIQTVADADLAPIVLVGHLQHLGMLDWRTTLAKGAPNVDHVLVEWI